MSTHEIVTLEDVLSAVTDENISGFLADFEAWLRLSLHDWTPATYAPVFRWHDDGNYGVMSGVHVRTTPKDAKEASALKPKGSAP